MKIVINGVEWHGFQRMKLDAPPDSILVVAWFDGEPEIWNCSGFDGVESLHRYYRNEWGDRDIPFNIAALVGKEL